MRWQHYIFYFFLIWYSFGVILVGFNLLPTWLEWANSVFIITAGVLGVIYFVRGFGAIYGVSISTLIFSTTFIVGIFRIYSFHSFWLSNRFRSAFFRPPNKSSIASNLYFVGGSTHPGGGSPLVTLGGMHVADAIVNQH